MRRVPRIFPIANNGESARIGLNPQIRLSLLGGNTEKIVTGVLEETLAIGLIEGPSLHRDLGEEPFVADEIAVIVPSKHEWGR